MDKDKFEVTHITEEKFKNFKDDTKQAMLYSEYNKDILYEFNGVDEMIKSLEMKESKKFIIGDLKNNDLELKIIYDENDNHRNNKIIISNDENKLCEFYINDLILKRFALDILNEKVEL